MIRAWVNSCWKLKQKLYCHYFTKLAILYFLDSGSILSKECIASIISNVPIPLQYLDVFYFTTESYAVIAGFKDICYIFLHFHFELSKAVSFAHC